MSTILRNLNRISPYSLLKGTNDELRGWISCRYCTLRKPIGDPLFARRCFFMRSDFEFLFRKHSLMSTTDLPSAPPNELLLIKNDTTSREEQLSSPPVKVLLLNTDPFLSRSTSANDNTKQVSENMSRPQSVKAMDVSSEEHVECATHILASGDSLEIDRKNNDGTSQNAISKSLDKTNLNNSLTPESMPPCADYNEIECENNKSENETVLETLHKLVTIEEIKTGCIEAVKRIYEDKETESVVPQEIDIRDEASAGENIVLQNKVEITSDQGDVDTNRQLDLLAELPFLEKSFSEECVKSKEKESESKEDWTKEFPFAECDDWEGMFVQEISEKEEKKKKKGKKRKSKEKGDKMAKISPDHFVGIQITDKEVKSQFNIIQDAILEKKPDLKPAMVKIETLHLTLYVLRLEREPANVIRALDALENSYNILKEKEWIKNCILTFEGLGHFRNQVLFAKIKEGPELEHLKELVEIIQAAFEEKGFPREKLHFTPHLTIVKLSKSAKLRFKKIKSIPHEVYKEHATALLGTQRIDGIQLLQMGGKADSGYYQCLKEHPFPSSS